jgi:hypothetical protein
VRSRGKYAQGASIQTDWVTIERCRSTTLRVLEGVVEVRDFVKRTTVPVRAGDSYTARAKR